MKRRHGNLCTNSRERKDAAENQEERCNKNQNILKSGSKILTWKLN